MLSPLEGPGRKIRKLRVEKVDLIYPILGKHLVLYHILQNHIFVLSKFPTVSNHILSLHPPPVPVQVQLFALQLASSIE